MTTIQVDNDFARFGGKSYAINKINTVEVREGKPYGRGTAIICGIIAAFSVIGFLAEGFEIGLLVVAIIFGVLAWQSYKKAGEREYQLFLMTSSSEAQAFVTKSRDEVYDLRDQIEAAMLRHSRGGA